MAGLRLQLAMKQEVLERTIAEMDVLLAEAEASRAALAYRDTTIQDLTQQLENAKQREQELVEALETAKVAAERATVASTDLQPVTPEPKATSSTGDASSAMENEEESIGENGDSEVAQEMKSSGGVSGGNGPSGGGSKGKKKKRQPKALEKFQAMERAAAAEAAGGGAAQAELAPACKITMAARAGGGSGSGRNSPAGKGEETAKTP